MKAKLLPLLLVLPASLQAESADRGFRFDTIGLRGGVDNQTDVNIDTAELYATVTTPYQWKLGRSTVLDLNLEGGVGLLDHNEGSDYYFRFGPQFTVSFNNSPLHLVIGSGPAYLSEHTFGQRNLGGNFQFFTSMGLDWDLSENWTLGYRWHHISNAGIHDENPGLNMHVIGFSFRF